MSNTEKQTDLSSEQESMMRYMRHDSLMFGIIFVLFVAGMIVLAIVNQKTGFLTSFSATLLSKMGISF